MRLGVDTNILQRCVLGHAMRRVYGLIDRGVSPCTTQHNADELLQVLVHKMGMARSDAFDAAMRVLMAFEIVNESEYVARKPDADRRLQEAGKKDWPLLAAAMQFDWPVWTDDDDFFGVGVPVWSTYNVNLVAAA